MKTPLFLPDDYRFELGKAAVLRDGTDVTLIGTGVTSYHALKAAEQLARAGIGARVLSMACIKPLDTEAVLAAATETKGIVTVEEHQIIGGLGSAVAENRRRGCGRAPSCGWACATASASRAPATSCSNTSA